MVNDFRNILLFLIFYTLSYFLILFNFDGIYWDDWVGIQQTPETMNLLFDMIQHGLKGKFSSLLLLSEYPNYMSRIFIFIAYFISGLFVYSILKTIKELNNYDIFYLTLFYLIVPVFNSRFMFSIVPFFVPVLIFFFMFFLLTKYLRSDSFILRIFILSGFFLSFDTNSVLVFYGSVLIYIFYIKYSFIVSVQNIKSFILKYLDFILLPIIFFIVKLVFLKPYGLYENYNTIGGQSIIKSILVFFKSFDTALMDVLLNSLIVSSSLWFLTILIIFVVIKLNFMKKDYTFNLNTNIFLLLGLVIFILAIFPYCAVSKLPREDGFSTRFQILTPLGLSFIFYFFIDFISKRLSQFKKLKSILIILLVISFVSKNIYDYYKYEVDNLYMTSIKMNLKDHHVIKNNSTFIVNNNITDKLLYKRNIQFYEWNGLLKNIFNDDKRLMINYLEFHNKKNYLLKVKPYLQYNFSQWKESTPILVTITHNYKNVTMSKFKDDINLLKIYFNLYVLKFINYESYLNKVKTLTLIFTKSL